MTFLDRHLARRRSPEFWAWFAQNASRFEHPVDEGRLSELDARIRGVHPGLAFQICKARCGDWELEISAGGNPEVIEAVREVVAAAPSIPGWTVHAFRRPQPGLSVETDGRRYDARDIYYEVRRDGTSVHLHLYIDGLDRSTEELSSIGLVLLDSTIGELAAMRFTRLELRDGSQRGTEARPLTELPREITGQAWSNT